MLRKALSLKRFPYKSGCACSEKWGRPSTFALLFTRLGGHAPKSWTAAGLARAFFIRFYRFLGGYTPKKHWIFSRETGWSCSEFCTRMDLRRREQRILDTEHLRQQIPTPQSDSSKPRTYPCIEIPLEGLWKHPVHINSGILKTGQSWHRCTLSSNILGSDSPNNQSVRNQSPL